MPEDTTTPQLPGPSAPAEEVPLQTVAETVGHPRSRVDQKEGAGRLSEAVVAESMWDRVAADATLAQPVPIPTVIVKATVPMAPGASLPPVWEPQITETRILGMKPEPRRI